MAELEIIYSSRKLLFLLYLKSEHFIICSKHACVTNFDCIIICENKKDQFTVVYSTTKVVLDILLHILLSGYYFF